MRGMSWCLAVWLLMVVAGMAGHSIAADEPQASPLDALVARIQKAGLADKPFGLIVSVKLREDKVEAFLSVARKAQAASRKEPGCAEYTFHQNAETTTEVYVTEKWKNLKALQDHFASPHFQEMAGQLGGLVTESPQIRIVLEVTAQ
jgi:quinol monooxygenase YgiN